MARFNCMIETDPHEIKYTNEFGVEVSVPRRDYEYYIRYYIKRKWYTPEYYWLKDTETVSHALWFLRQELGDLLDSYTLNYQHRKVTAGAPGVRIGSRNTDRCTDDELVSTSHARTTTW